MRGEFVASCLRRSHEWIDIVPNIVINLFGTYGLRLKSLNVLGLKFLASSFLVILLVNSYFRVAPD